MQGIFQKENTDKVLKYGIYRHLPTYEKIIRNLVSFLKEKYIRYRNLKVVFNKTYSIDELKFLKDFQDLRIQNLDDKTMLIQYNYKLYSVTDIVSCLLKNTEVADFSIKDLEIEDVIKEVC